MAGFFKKLFGGGNAGAAASADVASSAPNEVYKDIEIRCAPQSEGGQWRIAGTLTKTIDGEQVTRRFLRADLLASKDEAVSVTLSKAKMIIDQNGPSLWMGDMSGPV